ncbi:MAG: DUF89 family protein, partial [Methylococcales bacterium]|nr:DUF89 family protein [Methylococcales bacterium]
PDCYPCFLRQALDAARRAEASEEQQRQILMTTMDELSAFPADAMPPQMAQQIHRQVRRLSDNSDPYLPGKLEATQKALDLYPELKKRVAQSPEPLETAVRIAIAGNIIDLGVSKHYDLEATLERVLHQTFAINDFESFQSALAQSKSTILYLGDNAGETVFDRVLIETLDRPVTYAVKAAPILNDATREDATSAGLDKITEIIDNGSDAPGTLLDDCSNAFRDRFEKADLIIAKGQGNYESLSGHPAPVFFLLQAKCCVIARNLSVTEGDIILKHSN